MPRYPIEGCTPEPLGSYLKGLGVLRLLSEQADPLARAWWKNGVFWLHTKWSRDEVLSFFIEGIGKEKKPIYAPTPIFAPWGGRPGFYADGNEKAKERLAIFRSMGQPGRFAAARQAIKATDDVLENHGWASLSKKKRADLKADIVAAMRNAWNGTALDWFDACLSLEEDARFGFLYGTGGNEGSADITNNFWELIEETIGVRAAKSGTRELLAAALFATPRVGGTSKTAGQLFPLAAGSANCGQTFEGSSSTNPWDVILMMEGAVLFAGAVTKRLSQDGKGKAAFPFMIDHLVTGEAATSIKDEAKQDGKVVRCRAEFWMPLWQSPTSLADIQALLSEGRLQRRSGERTQHTLHAMEAIKTLGVSRGVETFHRVALFERRGKGYYLASSLGFHATSRSSDSAAAQLSEVESFRQQVYENLREGPGISDRVLRARQRFHAALAMLLELDEHGGVPASDACLDVLTSAAGIEREVALLKDRSRILTPCPALTASWDAARDRSPEHDIARAISGIASWGDLSVAGQRRPGVDAIRSNLLPVARRGRSWVWDDTTRSCVWSQAASLDRNLAAMLRRRMIDAQRALGDGLPLWSPHGAGFESLLAFWDGRLDEQRLADLIHGLSLIDSAVWNDLPTDVRKNASEATPDLHRGAEWFGANDEPRVQLKAVRWRGGEPLDDHELGAAFELPRVYHLLKLCFLGGRLPCRPIEGSTRGRSGDEPFPPVCLDVLTLLLAGRVSEATQVAARRLRAKGYPAMLRDPDLQALDLSTDQCRRLAGMLFIPVRHPGVLAALAVKPEKTT